MIGSVSSIRLVERLGTTRVVAAGLAGLAANLAITLAWAPDMGYWLLGGWFFGIALSLGWIAGPATESIMGAVPEEKAGVASAMNDVTRQVAGALGTAVVGSIITTLYASRVSDSVAGLPEESRVAAEDSIGMANAVATTLPAAEGQQLTDAAADAFTEALALGFLATGVVAAIAVVMVRLWLPAGHRAADRTAGARPRPDAVPA